MKAIKLIGLLVCVFAANTAFANNNQRLLKLFHDYGMTKCDSYIIENSGLDEKPNWSVDISKHDGEVSSKAAEVILTTIYGSKGDTIKQDDVYLQTEKGCYLRTVVAVSFSGTCEKNIDGDFWYVSNPLQSGDYTKYSNAGGTTMYAKDLKLGNFSACVIEYVTSRPQGKHG